MRIAGLGHALAHGQRGPQPLVAERRRHPDVDDRDVGTLAEHGVHERVAVPDRRDDLDLVVAQEAGQAVAQQREILGDHGAHGSTASITVGPPSGLAIRSEPSSASTRCRSPWRPASGLGQRRRVRRRARDTTIASSRSCTSMSTRRAARAWRVRQALGGDEVRGRLDRGGRALGERRRRR